MNWLAVETRQLTRNFGRHIAVNRLDLAIPERSIHGLLGGSGAGKSTVLQLLAGLLQPTAGWATVLGLRIPEDINTLQPHIGYLGQGTALFSHLTAEEHLHYMGKLYRLSGKKLGRLIEKQLDEYELQAVRKLPTQALSPGQQRCLSLASITLHSPRILLLDEPTTGLDLISRTQFWNKLAWLNQQGVTVLISTSHCEEVEHCQNASILRSGVKRADGSITELITHFDAHLLTVANYDYSSLLQLKDRVKQIAEVISVSGAASELRIIMDKRISKPFQWLEHKLPGWAQGCKVVEATPSLQDVLTRWTSNLHS